MAVIRGAICAQNTIEDISGKAVELVAAILERNNVAAECVEAVIFTATEDLNAAYPAAAVRKEFAVANAAFMCMQEMRVEGALDHCLRVAVFVSGNSQQSVHHCYLGRAAVLRPDLPR